MSRLGKSWARAFRSSIHRTSSFVAGSAPKEFQLFPYFFSPAEQRILLAAALQKLDSTESRLFRKRSKAAYATRPLELPNVVDLFLSDDHYQFEEGHYDGVIRHFREMHVTSWPENETPGLSLVLDRLHSLCLTQPTQTHLLHLASHGEILPHIDNVNASGSWILGVSLGAPRIMRMEALEDPHAIFDVLLPSGSVYLQRDIVRFGYRHSILREGHFGEAYVSTGQRVSIMIRDRLSKN